MLAVRCCTSPFTILCSSSSSTTFVLIFVAVLLSICQAGSIINYNNANDVECSVNICSWMDGTMWRGGVVPQQGDVALISSSENITLSINNTLVQVSQVQLQGNATLLVNNSELDTQTISLSGNSNLIVASDAEIDGNLISVSGGAAVYCSGGSSINVDITSISQQAVNLEQCFYEGDIRTIYLLTNGTEFSPISNVYLDYSGIGFIADSGDLILNITLNDNAQLHITADNFIGSITFGFNSVVSGNIQGNITLNFPLSSATFASFAENVTVNLGIISESPPILAFPSATNVGIVGPSGPVQLSFGRDVLVSLSDVTLAGIETTANNTVLLTYIDDLTISDADFTIKGKMIVMDDSDVIIQDSNITIYNAPSVSMVSNDLIANNSFIFSDSPIVMSDAQLTDVVIVSSEVIISYLVAEGTTSFANGTQLSSEDVYLNGSIYLFDGGSMYVENSLSFYLPGSIIMATILSIKGTIVVHGIKTTADLAQFPNQRVLLANVMSFNGTTPSITVPDASPELSSYVFSLEYLPDENFGLYMTWVEGTPTPSPTPTPAPKPGGKGWVAAPVLIAVAIIGGVVFYTLVWRKRHGYSTLPQ